VCVRVCVGALYMGHVCGLGKFHITVCRFADKLAVCGVEAD